MSRFIEISAFLIGLALIGLTLASRAKARTVMAWPKVPGTILKSAVAKRGDDYFPDIHYEYTVGAVRHQGKTVQVRLLPDSRGRRSQRICERYPQGKAVQIYVNPADPGDCMLEAALDSTYALVMIGWGAFTVVVALLLLSR